MRSSVLAAFPLATLVVANSFAITVSTVPIGNAGNPADTRYITAGVGRVTSPYRIGTKEITNAQYAAFLNAVAASDPYILYSTEMNDQTQGGIVRTTGTDGNYSYSVKAPAIAVGPQDTDYSYDNKPVNFVSFYSVIRFANWMHNGQGAGATETGVYALGAVNAFGEPLNTGPIPRSAGARWWLPSEDEWYKAAYYNPNLGSFYDFATSTSTPPNNNLPTNDTGNSANFYSGAFTTGSFSYPMTDVGAYQLSRSPYRTYDQTGNVSEWTETEIIITPGFPFRVVRGGSWDHFPTGMPASVQDWSNATFGQPYYGFRIARLQPTFSGALFGDDFEYEVPNINYTNFAQWTVTRGNIGVIGNGFLDVLPGNGLYLDMNPQGETGGTIQSDPLPLDADVPYVLSFNLAGSQLGTTNSLTYGVDLNADGLLDFAGSQTLNSSAPFTQFTLLFTPSVSTTNAQIVFEHANGTAGGLKLDNIRLVAVPEPAAMMLILFAIALGVPGRLLKYRREIANSYSV